jgi:hypothetical protein
MAGVIERVASEFPSDNVSRWNAMSPVDCSRAEGSFSRQCVNTRASEAGILALACESSLGSAVRMALIVSTEESPWNARAPVSIS